jgi:hypothetical protein
MVFCLTIIGLVIGMIASVLYIVEWREHHPRKRPDEFDY